jgi:hypothetical protein
MEWWRNKSSLRLFNLFFLSSALLCISSVSWADGAKLKGSVEDKLSLGSSDSSKEKVVPEKKVSFSGEKAHGKLFGSIPLPWPFNITNTQLPNQNPQGDLTGSGLPNLGDAGGLGGSFGTLGTSAVLVSPINRRSTFLSFGNKAHSYFLVLIQNYKTQS